MRLFFVDKAEVEACCCNPGTLDGQVTGNTPIVVANPPQPRQPCGLAFLLPRTTVTVITPYSVFTLVLPVAVGGRKSSKASHSAYA